VGLTRSRVQLVKGEVPEDELHVVAILVRKIGDAEGWDRNERRDFQTDALIILTARRHGATVVTANLSGSDLLARELRIHMLAVRA
jgi:hypothetical protein